MSSIKDLRDTKDSKPVPEPEPPARERRPKVDHSLPDQGAGDHVAAIVNHLGAITDKAALKTVAEAVAAQVKAVGGEKGSATPTDKSETA